MTGGTTRTKRQAGRRPLHDHGRRLQSVSLPGVGRVVHQSAPDPGTNQRIKRQWQQVLRATGRVCRNISLNYEGDWSSRSAASPAPTFPSRTTRRPASTERISPKRTSRVPRNGAWRQPHLCRRNVRRSHAFRQLVHRRQDDPEQVDHQQPRTSQSSDGGPTNANSLSSACSPSTEPVSPSRRTQLPDRRRVPRHQPGRRRGNRGYHPVVRNGERNRFLAAAQYAIDITDDIAVTPLVEYVHFWNGGGYKDEDRDYLTATALFTYQQLEPGVRNDAEMGRAAGRRQLQRQPVAGLGRICVRFRPRLDVGWKYLTEEGMNTRHWARWLPTLYEF